MRYGLITPLILSVLVTWIAPQRFYPQDPATAGIGHVGIAARVSGYVVWTKGRREIRAVSLPAMKETIVWEAPAAEGGNYPTIHAISGPDSRGRIAYIEDLFFVAREQERKHLLKTIQIGGAGETVMFSRPGSAMWAATRAGRGEIGTHIALAPSGGKVAFLSELSERQMPGALLQEGEVEIWDIETKRRREVELRAVDRPLSWFPDGQQLAYLRLVPRRELPKDALGLAEFGEYRGQPWDKVLAVYVLSLDSGRSSFLHVGWTPVVAHDGRSVLVGGWNGRSTFSWRLLDLESRRSVAVHLPEDGAEVIASPADKVVVYKGLPVSKSASGDSRPVLGIHLAVVNSEEWQPVVPLMDARDLVSFGRFGGP